MGLLTRGRQAFSERRSGAAGERARSGGRGWRASAHLRALALPLAAVLVASTITAPAASGAEALFAVNAGGPALSGWQGDSAGAPSAYSNAAATGNTTYAVGTTIDTSHPSLPAGTPMTLFQSERYDGPAAPEMQWTFPVSPGSYEVRLYFAEIYAGTQVVGARKFDVAIEGAKLLTGYDVFADVGANKGVVKSFVIQSDASLTVDFLHVTENPALKAIAVLPAAQGGLTATPAAVDFGSVKVDATTSQTVTLRNAGATGAPAITVSGTTITGAHAAQFSDSFPDGSGVSLPAGGSVDVTVSFRPTSTGSKVASMSVTHSGSGSPTSVALAGNGASEAPISFGKSKLAGTTSSRVTSIQFGPDGRLYAAQQDGLIKAYTVTRSKANAYAVTATETIGLVKAIPNHNDDGTPNPNVNERIVTGILVTGTAANPVIYATSSDPRIGGGGSGADLGLDTNSSMISRLTRSGSAWQKVDLVRGLPRSEENHSANGMQLDAAGSTLYVAHGGNTNMGAPSNNFARLPEFALSAAILKVDLSAIGSATYDLPTLDDDSRPGTADANDPFGGNNGKNQAKLVPGGPVQVHASGFRNPYDVVVTSAGRMYTIDNGGNAGWGGIPKDEGPQGTCTNALSEPGVTEPDTLHLVTPGYYGGHPNPTRGNKANTFNTNPVQSPVATANAVECDYRTPDGDRGNITSFPASTNGLVEYTASNFGGAMKGDLLTAAFDNKIHRVKLDGTGKGLVLSQALFSTVDATPLDVTALGDSSPFPGTVWSGDVQTGHITVFEPADFGGGGVPACTGAYSWTLDEDGDGFKNADEIDNGTNPCSAADVPPDHDRDGLSDLNDPDDDGDGIPDASDKFAWDAQNGTTTALPVRLTWDNEGEQRGGLLNLGFTGLMTNGTTDYAKLFDAGKMTAGGAAGVTTVDEVSEGTALGTVNTQEYGFQFGAKPKAGATYTAHTRILGPFAGLTPQGNQSMGLFLGTGTQDDYAKLVVTANGGSGGVQFQKEAAGAAVAPVTSPVKLPGPDAIDLYLTVDGAAKTVTPSYAVTTGGVMGPRVAVGGAVSLPDGWFSTGAVMAFGLISTSAGAAPPFPATWDLIEAYEETAPGDQGVWETRAPSGPARQEVAYVNVGGKLYLAGGGTAHEVYNPATNSWSAAAPLPVNLDHIQSVAVGGIIYYIGGLTSWPSGHVHSVYAYNPATNTFTQKAPMPNGRGRGAGGVAVHDGKIYYAGGLHGGSAVTFFDVYDPATDTWTALPNMPRPRDHFHAAVVGGKLYAIGGRNAAIDATTTANDVFDLTTRAWSTGLAPLPTARGGFAAAVLGEDILIIGGEGGGKAFAEVEAYNTTTNTWRALRPMPTPRHGIQAAVCNGGVYIAAGGKIQGGGGATNVHEVFFRNAPTTCSATTDTTPPTVVATNPTAGATGVPIGATVTVTFSEALNPASVTTITFTLAAQGSTSPIPAAVTYSGTTATLDPTTDLAAGATYTATVKGGPTGVTDVAGNPMTTDRTWTFTTAATTSPPPPPPPPPPTDATTSHIADLDGSSTSQGNTWTANVQVLVHDGAHKAAAGATVSYTWSSGAKGSCVTGTTGQCQASVAGIRKNVGSIVLTVTNVTHPSLTYAAAGNHDPDGDSDGTAISIRKS
jgi:large repetitive protein